MEDQASKNPSTCSSDSFIYLNNAAMARYSTAVQQAGMAHIQNQFLPDDDHVSAVRTHFARLIDADPTRIAIMPSTAFAITLAARNLIPAGDTSGKEGAILLLEDQYASALFPWQRAVQQAKESNNSNKLRLHLVSYPRKNETWTDNILKALSEISDILVVCMPPLHWADGAKLDLDRISEACFCRNIPFIVDATQATGAVPVSIRTKHVALLACSAHKWLRGPSGTCLVYINPAYQEVWHPLDEHGRGRLHHPDATGPNGYPEEFFPDARKFDSGGKPNPILLPMLRASLETVVELNMDTLQDKLREISQPLLDWVATDDRVSLPDNHGYHLMGVKPTEEKNANPERMEAIRKRLQAEHGIIIAVRCGSFRVSPYLDNTPDDIERFVHALRSILDQDE